MSDTKTLVDVWRAEVDTAMASMLKEISFHVWCPDDYLKALHHIREAALTYERVSRMEGRLHYWERKRTLGRIPQDFDLEKQILHELGTSTHNMYT